MENVVLSALLIAATALGIAMVVPQIVHIHRTRSTDGVSIMWIGVGVALNSWWTVYAIGAGVWGLTPVSVSGMALYVTMLVQFSQLHGLRSLGGFLGGAITFALLPLPALLLGGIEAAGIVVGLCYAVQFLPAVIESLRAETLHGLSLSTWAMALGEALIWAIYGASVADNALIIGGTGASVASLMIVGQICRVRKPRIVFAA